MITGFGSQIFKLSKFSNSQLIHFLNVITMPCITHCKLLEFCLMVKWNTCSTRNWPKQYCLIWQILWGDLVNSTIFSRAKTKNFECVPETFWRFQNRQSFGSQKFQVANIFFQSEKVLAKMIDETKIVFPTYSNFHKSYFQNKYWIKYDSFVNKWKN